MENKDQRLEIRIPQQQLTEVDAIINSIDPRFKPSRSDVVRSFIAQGIDRHYGRGRQVQDLLPLGQRLSLFFQICQQQRAVNGSRVPLSRADDYLREMIPNYKESTATVEALVSQVYLQGFTWFYELDQKHLEAINIGLTSLHVLSLMNQEHNPETCSTLDSVIAIRNMFAQIDTVLNEANKKKDMFGDDSVRDSLARIEGYASDNRIPLRFRGYPDTAEYTQQIQMWSLLNWIEIGEGSNPISTSEQRHKEDLTGKYAIMLEVYRNITLNQRFTLDALEQLVKNRQFS
ncbi:hypothetical protein KU74_07235 [Pectobacterium brasiliense]|uniref:Uncharacterized protein n=1 Tax=Pectobacterium brasiliense TaxID=180957 RepID=A0A0M2F7K9_9GAMM|nr:hypothetical protein [Pectobacterium brasiliense]KGA36251.1 hypothetical protein KU74_07235 [Pectobacterium brasiliense]